MAITWCGHHVENPLLITLLSNSMKKSCMLIQTQLYGKHVTFGSCLLTLNGWSQVLNKVSKGDDWQRRVLHIYCNVRPSFSAAVVGCNGKFTPFQIELNHHKQALNLEIGWLMKDPFIESISTGEKKAAFLSCLWRTLWNGTAWIKTQVLDSFSGDDGFFFRLRRLRSRLLNVQLSMLCITAAAKASPISPREPPAESCMWMGHTIHMQVQMWFFNKSSCMKGVLVRTLWSGKTSGHWPLLLILLA